MLRLARLLAGSRAYRVSPTFAVLPRFLTRWRGEVRERPVSTRREPLGEPFLNNAGVLEQYVERGEQAQQSNGGPIAYFDRQLLRNGG